MEKLHFVYVFLCGKDNYESCAGLFDILVVL